MKIIRAILAGKREPEKLVQLCVEQILKTKRGRMIEALHGLWCLEHLFALRLALESYEAYQKQIQQCDEQMAQVLQEMSGGRPTPELGQPKELRHNALMIPNLRVQMGQVFGKDLAQLPCLNESTVTLLLAEIGTDISRWPGWRHFGSWLAVSPSSVQSGKRRRREKRHLTPDGRILCRAVQYMAVGKHAWLASFYRRLRVTNKECATPS
jgi:transposase